VIKIRGFCG
jgi:hypothetical protein